jgi:hypothetical protein
VVSRAVDARSAAGKRNHSHIERQVRHVSGAALFLGLAAQAVRQRSSLRRAALVDDALGCALVELIAYALQTGHRCRIGVAGANVELLSVLAGHVGIDQAEVIIETLVDRRVRGACGRDREASQRHRPPRGQDRTRGGSGEIQSGPIVDSSAEVPSGGVFQAGQNSG